MSNLHSHVGKVIDTSRRTKKKSDVAGIGPKILFGSSLSFQNKELLKLTSKTKFYSESKAKAPFLLLMVTTEATD